jgi:hypothetical protein
MRNIERTKGGLTRSVPLSIRRDPAARGNPQRAVLVWDCAQRDVTFPAYAYQRGLSVTSSRDRARRPDAPFGGLRADKGTEGPGGPEKGKGSFTKALRTGELQNEAKHGGRDPFVFL